MSEDTEAFLGYDEDNIFVAFDARDSSPPGPGAASSQEQGLRGLTWRRHQRHDARAEGAPCGLFGRVPVHTQARGGSFPKSEVFGSLLQRRCAF